MKIFNFFYHFSPVHPSPLVIPLACTLSSVLCPCHLSPPSRHPFPFPCLKSLLACPLWSFLPSPFCLLRASHRHELKGKKFKTKENQKEEINKINKNVKYYFNYHKGFNMLFSLFFSFSLIDSFWSLFLFVLNFEPHIYGEHKKKIWNININIIQKKNLLLDQQQQQNVECQLPSAKCQLHITSRSR
jgi:hypothetical protein